MNICKLVKCFQPAALCNNRKRFGHYLNNNYILKRVLSKIAFEMENKSIYFIYYWKHCLNSNEEEIIKKIKLSADFNNLKICHQSCHSDYTFSYIYTLIDLNFWVIYKNIFTFSIVLFNGQISLISMIFGYDIREFIYVSYYMYFSIYNISTDNLSIKNRLFLWIIFKW